MKPAPSSGHVTEPSKAQKFTFCFFRGRADSIAFAPNPNSGRKEPAWWSEVAHGFCCARDYGGGGGERRL